METKTQSETSAVIGARILALKATGLSTRQAFDQVLGAGAFDKLAGDLYDALNAKKKTIVAGTTLKARSIGDQDCIFEAEVLTRKGSFVTVKAQNQERRVKIQTDSEGNEFIYALGRYSMAPIFRAI